MTAQGGVILAWLKDAIRERERVASNAAAEAGGEWREDPFVYGVRDQKNALVAKSREDRARSIVHIAANNPESVLRRCAADRKLIAAHPITRDVVTVLPDGTHGFGCSVCHREDLYVVGDGWCDTVLALAEGYGWTEGER